MNRNDYWRKREEEQLKHYLTEEAEIQRAMAEKYNYMLYQIQSQINDFYARYARREQITLAEAKQRVSRMDVQAFSAKAKKYVEEKNFTTKANQELRLYNATMRINRLELLKANIGLEMVDGFNDLEQLMDGSLTKRTEDELIRQAGILGETISDNAKTARSIVNASFNTATWSERIWGNQAALRDSLSSLLTQGLIQGRNPRVLAPELQKLFGVSRRNAERLMATELARVQTAAQMESFKQNDIDQYIFLSLDTACSHCMALNEKHFPVKDMMPGENAPPIHPNCRCSTAAYLDREALERELFGESEFREEGHKGKNRTTEIATSRITSGDYGRRISKINENRKVKQRVRDEMRAILDHRNGTEYEDLVYIDSRTGEFKKRVDYNKRLSVKPNEKMKSMVEHAPDNTIIAIHNHTYSGAPSPEDICNAADHKYKYGIIACHNGDIYKYSANETFVPPMYASALAKLERGEYTKSAIEIFISDCERAGVKMEIL